MSSDWRPSRGLWFGLNLTLSVSDNIYGQNQNKMAKKSVYTGAVRSVKVFDFLTLKFCEWQIIRTTDDTPAFLIITPLLCGKALIYLFVRLTTTTTKFLNDLCEQKEETTFKYVIPVFQRFLEVVEVLAAI